MRQEIGSSHETHSASSLQPSEDNSMRRYHRFARVVVVEVVLGAITFLLGFSLVNVLPSFRDTLMMFLTVPLSLAFFVLALGTAIFMNFMSLRAKQYPNRIDAVGRVILFGILFVVASGLFLERSLLLIYTPPAITQENLPVFNRCLKFVKTHDADNNFGLVRWGWVTLTGDTFLALGTASSTDRIKEFFSQDEIAEMQELAERLQVIDCHKFQRCDGVVLFYKTMCPIPPMRSSTEKPMELLGYVLSVASAILQVVPTNPGAVYSLNGKNPNEIDNAILNSAKPFIKIEGNWYTSRRLVLVGLRSDTGITTPKSLIDRSLKIEGIDANELHKFD